MNDRFSLFYLVLSIFSSEHRTSSILVLLVNKNRGRRKRNIAADPGETKGSKVQLDSRDTEREREREDV